MIPRVCHVARKRSAHTGRVTSSVVARIPRRYERVAFARHRGTIPVSVFRNPLHLVGTDEIAPRRTRRARGNSRGTEIGFATREFTLARNANRA